MDCPEWNDTLALWDEAPKEKRDEADAHAATCDECRRVAEGWKRFEEALLDDEDEVDDPLVREKVLAAARASLDGSRRRLVILVVLAIALLVATVLVWRSTGSDAAERRLIEAEDQLTHGDFEDARRSADAVLSLPGASELEKEHARRIKERAR